jgi:hypothetical protein
MCAPAISARDRRLLPGGRPFGESFALQGATPAAYRASLPFILAVIRVVMSQVKR